MRSRWTAPLSIFSNRAVLGAVVEELDRRIDDVPDRLAGLHHGAELGEINRSRRMVAARSGERVAVGDFLGVLEGAAPAREGYGLTGERLGLCSGDGARNTNKAERSGGGEQRATAELGIMAGRQRGRLLCLVGHVALPASRLVE